MMARAYTKEREGHPSLDKRSTDKPQTISLNRESSVKKRSLFASYLELSRQIPEQYLCLS